MVKRATSVFIPASLAREKTKKNIDAAEQILFRNVRDQIDQAIANKQYSTVFYRLSTAVIAELEKQEYQVKVNYSRDGQDSTTYIVRWDEGKVNGDNSGLLQD